MTSFLSNNCDLRGKGKQYRNKITTFLGVGKNSLVRKDMEEKQSAAQIIKGNDIKLKIVLLRPKFTIAHSVYSKYLCYVFSKLYTILHNMYHKVASSRPSYFSILDPMPQSSQ